MEVTRYFAEQVLRKRPYIQPAWLADVLAAPLRRVVQPDGRIRYWGRVTDPRDGQTRILRIVTLEDGQTMHNAFFDRGYKEDTP